MADPLERVVVSIGGKSWDGFTTVSITLGVDQAARTASVSGSDLAGINAVEPGDDAVLSASGTTIITGEVRTVNPSHDGERHTVTLEIVSRVVDAVECSIDHPTGFVKKKDFVAIAREFDTMGVGIESPESFPVEPRRRVNTGESLVDHLRDLARSHGAFIYDTPEGKMMIAKKPRGRHSGGVSIGIGGNIIAASAQLSVEGRHKTIKVRGQSAQGKGDGALRLEAKATDSTIKRNRTRIIIHESETTAGKLKERADRAVRRASGYSKTASVTVSGWRDAGGRIWEPHFLVACRNPRIYIDQDMAIQSVTLTQSTESGGEGTRAVLSLVDPAALNGSGSSSGNWQTGKPSATVGTA